MFVFGGRIKATKELNNDLLIGQLDANQKAVSWSRMYVCYGNNMSLPERTILQLYTASTPFTLTQGSGRFIDYCPTWFYFFD